MLFEVEECLFLCFAIKFIDLFINIFKIFVHNKFFLQSFENLMSDRMSRSHIVLLQNLNRLLSFMNKLYLSIK